MLRLPALALCAAFAPLPALGAELAPLLARDAAPALAAEAQAVEPGAPRDRAAEVDRWLQTLRSDSAAERARGERALAAIVTWDDFEVLRRAASEGDAEVRQRLVEVLAADERQVELAARFAVEDDRALAELGRMALGELVSRWSTGLRAHGEREADLAAELEDDFERPLVLDARQPLEAAINQLARFGGDGPPLVVDPLWEPPRRPRREIGDLTGTLDRLLPTLARFHGGALEGFGFDAGDAGRSPRAKPWILVTSADRAGTQLGHEHWIDWCAAVVAGGPGRTSTRCARALAESQWPAALAWIEARWLVLGDAHALEGLVAAADRGRTARALATSATQRALVARMREVLGATADEERDAFASQIARALASAGSKAPDGEDLSPIAVELLAGADGSSGRAQRWLALVVLEGHAEASAETRARVRAIVEDGDARAVRPAMRFQALRALAAMTGASRSSTAASASRPSTAAGAGGGAVRIGDAQGLVEWGRSADAGLELLELAMRVDAGPPTAWSDPAGVPAGWDFDQRARVLEWWFATGDEATAARHLGALAARNDPRELEDLAARLVACAQRRERFGSRGTQAERGAVESLLSRAAREGLVATAAIEELAILAGASAALVPPEAIERRLASRANTRRELVCLAALAATDVGARARAAVIAGLTSPLPIDDRIAAVDRALAELRRARTSSDERSFVTGVRAAIRDADREILSRLRVDLWPAPIRPEVVSLRRVDRVLDRASL